MRKITNVKITSTTAISIPLQITLFTFFWIAMRGKLHIPRYGPPIQSELREDTMANTIQTIPIKTQPEYAVSIAPGLLGRCGELIASTLAPCRAAVVTDSNVAKLFLPKVEDSLRAAGFAVCAHIFPAGEENKNLSTLSLVLEFLAEEQLTRSDCVVALGGGVCGDMSCWVSPAQSWRI